MLQFDGLDTYASIYLNGKLVGKTHDMFIPFEFNISKGWLKIGKNEIEVRFAPAVASVANKLKADPIFYLSAKGTLHTTYAMYLWLGLGQSLCYCWYMASLSNYSLPRFTY